MPHLFHSHDFSRIVADAGQLAERIREHERQLDVLLATAQRDLREARAALVQSTASGTDLLTAVIAGHVHRTSDSADAAKRLAIGAHEQHLAVRRLLADLDADTRRYDPRRQRLNGVVLVVDDHDGVRDLVARVLDSGGFLVRTAVNGLEALIAAHQARPSVIVMDLMMPVLNGIEATRLLRADEATRDARIVAHTSQPIEEVPAATLFDAVLQKPASPDVLLATVQRMAAR